MKTSVKFSTLACCVAAVAFTFAGCEKKTDSDASTTDSTVSPTTVAATFNTMCPVMQDEAVSADAVTVEFGGHTIGFCCDDCLPKWEAMNDAAKNAFIAVDNAIDDAGEAAGETLDAAGETLKGIGDDN